MLKSIQILRPGKFKAMNGTEVSLSENDLAKIAKNYSQEIFDAPVVLGHPKHNEGAYGWVKSLNFTNGILTAKPEKLAPKLVELIEAGKYKKVSASLFLPDCSANPRPGEFYLRHVGILGACAPAVSGLAPITLSADEKDIVWVEFAIGDEVTAPESKPNQEPNKEAIELLEKEKQALEAREKALEEREKALEAKEAEIKKAEFASFISDLVKVGRIHPKAKDSLVEFMQNIDSKDVIDFSEKKQTAVEFFKGYLSKQPKLVELGEFAGDDKEISNDLTPVQLAEKLTELCSEMESKGMSISYAEAAARITGGQK